MTPVELLDLDRLPEHLATTADGAWAMGECAGSPQFTHVSFGVEASEFMTAVQVAMLGRLPYTVLRSAIFTHPTAAEGLTFLLIGPPAGG